MMIVLRQDCERLRGEIGETSIFSTGKQLFELEYPDGGADLYELFRSHIYVNIDVGNASPVGYPESAQPLAKPQPAFQPFLTCCMYDDYILGVVHVSSKCPECYLECRGTREREQAAVFWLRLNFAMATDYEGAYDVIVVGAGD